MADLYETLADLRASERRLEADSLKLLSAVEKVLALCNDEGRLNLSGAVWPSDIREEIQDALEGTN